MSNLKKILLSLCSIFYIWGNEPFRGYIYPVDTIYHDGILKMCVLYQKQNRLELFFWDPTTEKAILGLLSFFQPTSLTVLPNKEAFSFIDNDRIKIKYLSKRSPKAIDLYGPYNFTTVSWIDNENFYFSAKERRHYNLFHATIHGDLVRLTVSNTYHYLYPQKIDETLFFIEETTEGCVSIKKIQYPVELINAKLMRNKDVSLEEEMRTIMQQESNKSVYTPLLDIESASTLIALNATECQNSSIAFLKMKSLIEGFFVSYITHIEPKQTTLILQYYRIYNHNNNWHKEFLFDFSIPLYLVLPTKKEITMSESIFPFLPFHTESSIYFTYYNEDTDSLELYEYQNRSGSTKKVVASGYHKELFFAPRCIGQKIIHGGNVLEDHKPGIYLKDDGYQYFAMPYINPSDFLT